MGFRVPQGNCMTPRGDGPSAYEQAVIDGFIGTETDWIRHIVDDYSEKELNDLIRDNIKAGFVSPHIFADIETALAELSLGQYFTVPNENSDTYLTLYWVGSDILGNNIAVKITEYPSLQLLLDTKNSIDNFQVTNDEIIALLESLYVGSVVTESTYISDLDNGWFNLTNIRYVEGSNQLNVIINGVVYVEPGLYYEEHPDGDKIRITNYNTEYEADDEIYVVSKRMVPEFPQRPVDAGSVIYSVDPTKTVREVLQELKNQVTDLYSQIANNTDGKIGSPKDYGAVGDGVTDDTEAVQLAVSELDICLIDKPYAVSDTISIEVFTTCIGEGKIVYIGPEPDSTKLVVDLKAKHFGVIHVDGSNKEVRLVSVRTGSTHYGDTIITRNVQSSDPNKSVSSGLACQGQSTLNINRHLAYNLINNGHPNDSFPQALVADDNCVINVGLAYLDGGATHLITAGLTKETGGVINADKVHFINAYDNGIYCLQGSINVGDQYFQGETGEPVVNRSTVNIGTLTAQGKTIAMLRLQEAVYTRVDRMVGLPTKGQAPSSLNTPGGFCQLRTGNTNSGVVKIGSISGDFRFQTFSLGYNGVVEKLEVDSVDATLHFIKSNPNWSFSNWFNLSNVKEFHMGDVRIRIRDEDDALIQHEPSEIFRDTITGQLTKLSDMDSFGVSIHNSDMSLSAAADYRGTRQLELFRINSDCTWMTNTSVPYRKQITDGPAGSIVVGDEPPLSGWWARGTVLKNERYLSDNPSASARNIQGWIKLTDGEALDWEPTYYNPFNKFVHYRGTFNSNGVPNTPNEATNCTVLTELNNPKRFKLTFAAGVEFRPDTIDIRLRQTPLTSSVFMAQPLITVNDKVTEIEFFIWKQDQTDQLFKAASGSDVANVRVEIYSEQKYSRGF